MGLFPATDDNEATSEETGLGRALLALAVMVAGETRRAPQLDGWGLTTRERELLRRAIRGETNAEIGEALSISSRTVGKHLEHAYAKLGVHGRREAARLVAMR
jgi:DNA-binding CsgD family transcriptional regulator